MHNITYKSVGLVVLTGIFSALSAQGLQAAEPARVDGIVKALSVQHPQSAEPRSLNRNQRSVSPVRQVGHSQDKCGCKHKHVYSYSDRAAYSDSNCPQCRSGCRRTAGIGKRGSLREFLRCKFGYFIPTGCGGKGCPPFGHYKMTYAVDPYQFDQRDGQLYGAQGYGVPVAVPLAPNVRHTYNYGWGIPSSRITPVTRIVQ